MYTAPLHTITKSTLPQLSFGSMHRDRRVGCATTRLAQNGRLRSVQAVHLNRCSLNV